MTSNVAPCSTWRLYVILDADASRGRDLAWIADLAIQGGADVLQLRDKTALAKPLGETATRLLKLTRAAKIPLLINDRADVAAAVGADGVHLGQDDLPVEVARRLLGPRALIGCSTHSLEQAAATERQGVDYLAVGPIFSTPTKPDYPSVGLSVIQQVTAHIRTPLVVIGGIDSHTLPSVLSAGATCVAVVRAICGAEHPREAAHELKQTLAQFGRVTA